MTPQWTQQTTLGTWLQFAMGMRPMKKLKLYPYIQILYAIKTINQTS